ncbi:MAG: PIG-L family deacetylase [Pseudomonadota bacterium]|nr:PIG-L family deacetylase [Pseudomonadota bacterium]
MFGKRILILVPHPDDEVVACAATIGRARAAGAEVFALYLTHGCIAREALWPWQRRHYEFYVSRRIGEAKTAARFLGLQPVGWSPRPARHLWRALPAVRDEIRAAINQHHIDQLWVPAYEGGNADHDGLNAVAQSFRHLSILEFAEYNFFEQQVRSQSFPFPNGTEHRITLTSADRLKKSAALAFYRSEKLNLNYVKTEHECFRALASYDYTRPPHGGTLWYARFQWVPFRHPRVDFTNPAEVCAAAAQFLRQEGLEPESSAMQS